MKNELPYYPFFIKMDTDIVFYHGGCPDGFGSAFAIWKLLGDKPIYKPYFYHYKFSDFQDIINKNVVVCDFSFPKEIILEIIKKAKSFLLIDHHVTTINNLTDISNKYFIFNSEHSGAYLTWKHFHPNIEVPRLLLYIEDRDIWKNKLPFTKEFFCSFKNVPQDFNEYAKLLDYKEIDKLIEKGKIILEYDNIQMNYIMKNSICKMTVLPDNELYNIAYVSSNIHKSDIGNKLLEKYPYADFSVVYGYNDRLNNTTFSLRSDNKRIDVSKIAKLFNGGGHRNASGFLIIGNKNELAAPFFSNDVEYLLNCIEKNKITIEDTEYDYLEYNCDDDPKIISNYLIRKIGKEYNFIIINTSSGYFINFNELYPCQKESVIYDFTKNRKDHRILDSVIEKE